MYGWAGTQEGPNTHHARGEGCASGHCRECNSSTWCSCTELSCSWSSSSSSSPSSPVVAASPTASPVAASVSPDASSRAQPVCAPVCNYNTMVSTYRLFNTSPTIKLRGNFTINKWGAWTTTHNFWYLQRHVLWEVVVTFVHMPIFSYNYKNTEVRKKCKTFPVDASVNKKNLCVGDQKPHYTVHETGSESQIIIYWELNHAIWKYITFHFIILFTTAFQLYFSGNRKCTENYE